MPSLQIIAQVCTLYNHCKSPQVAMIPKQVGGVTIKKMILWGFLMGPVKGQTLTIV